MEYEVAIIGGASAGLSAALTMGRSNRKTVVFDTGSPRNKPAPHAHNLFTRDGTSPLELLRIGREQLQQYTTVSFVNKKVIKAEKRANRFVLTTEDGTETAVRRVILATGVIDVLPEINGFKALWGTKIIHCPYCHGWEVKDQPVGLIMNGEQALHMAIMINHWNKDLRIFTNGPSEIEVEGRKWLKNKGIEVIETPIAALVDDSKGVLMKLNDGTQVVVTAVYSKGARLHFNNELAAQLGCALTVEGAIVVDEMNLSSILGVFAVGDVAHPQLHQVIMAAAGGAKAGAACNNGLIMEDYEQSK
jgi:thioredoxin reductase